MSTTERIQGHLSIHPRGFGFIDLVSDDGPDSAFVAPRDLHGLLDGDAVSARLITEKDGRSRAEDLEREGRWRVRLFGEVVKRRGTLFLRPDPRVANSDWKLVGDTKSLQSGDRVVANIDGNKARFDHRVPEDEAGLTGVLVNWGISRTYSKAAMKDIARSQPDLAERRDLRHVPTITIDSPHSRDLDDALSVVLPAQADGAVRVLVSIADVDSVVEEGSALDDEARRRMTSVYLPDCVVPMIPPELSEDRLSLLPGRDRPALTVELRITPEGEVTSMDVARSLIRSHARLSYKDVAAFLEQDEAEPIPEGVRPTLRWLRTAAARLSAARSARGGVQFEREEIRLELDAETGEPVDVNTYEATTAHQLVERLMVATNEAVARWLVDRGLPGLFRVQDEPDPDRVQNLVRFARNFGFETAFGARLSPRSLASFEQQFERSSVAPQVRTVLFRVLGRARYTAEPTSHFGLAAPLYVHFTSPIRRYADLMVHRIIKDHLAGHRDQTAMDPELEAIAESVNALSLRARRAQNERQRCLVAKLLSSRIGETFQGTIVAIKNFGVIVLLKGLGVTGAINASDLPDGPYRLDITRETLVGKKRSFVVGESITVKLAETDEALGRVDLTLSSQG